MAFKEDPSKVLTEKMMQDMDQKELQEVLAKMESIKQLNAVLTLCGLPKRKSKPKAIEDLLQHVRRLHPGQGPAPTSTKEWMKTSPFDFPPNQYHHGLFKANFPLVDIVQIHDGMALPILDKFGSTPFHAEDVFPVKKRWATQVHEAKTICPDPTTEGLGTDFHLSLLKLGFVTNLAAHELPQLDELLEQVGRKRDWEKAFGAEGRSCCKAEDEEYAGFTMDAPPELDGQPYLPRKQSDSENQLIQEQPCIFEGQLTDDAAVSGYSDVMLSVWDECPSKKICTNKKKTTVVVERKWLEDAHKEDARYQGGAYAVRGCVNNLQAGHGTPIYVLVLTQMKWTYGILVPHGFVLLQDGAVDPRSMQEFMQHEAITRSEKNMNLEELNEKLADGTWFLRRRWSDNPNGVHPNHLPQLVGTYYLQSKWFKLPEPFTVSGFIDPGVDKFFQGLLRVLLGDRCLSYKAEHFQLLMQKRSLYDQDTVFVAMGPDAGSKREVA